MQPAFGIVKHHTVFPPVQSSRRQYETHSPLRVKGMGDLKGFGCNNV
jgi:hypothetical protein